MPRERGLRLRYCAYFFGPVGNFCDKALIMSSAGKTSLASRMTKAAGAHAVLDVKNHVVIVIGRGSHRHHIKPEVVSYFPSNNVVRAGGIAAHSQAADDLPFAVVQGKPSAKYHDTADRFADHRIVLLAKCIRVSKGSLRIGRRERNQSVKALPWLGGEVDICG